VSAATIDPSVYIAPNAVVSGDVTVGAGNRILFGAVVTTEGGPVEIGSDCIVMENAVLRGRRRFPLRLCNHVLVGPHLYLNGVFVEDDVFLATGVSAFPGAHIERGAEVRINSVHVNSRVLRDAVVPIGWIAVGAPAEFFSPERYDEYWPKLKALDFPGTVFGIPRAELTMRKLTAGYLEAFGAHAHDTVVGEAP